MKKYHFMSSLLVIALVITAAPLQAQESRSKTEKVKAFLSKHKKKIAVGAAAATATALGGAILLSDSEKEKIRKQHNFPAKGTYESRRGIIRKVTGYSFSDEGKWVNTITNEKPGKLSLNVWNQEEYKRK